MTTKPEDTKPEETPNNVKQLKVARQGELDGMEKPRIAELDTLMEELHAKSKQLSTLRNEVGDLKKKLLQAAQKHDVLSYRDDTAVPPLVLTRKTREDSVKVAPAEDVELVADDDGDAGEGEEPLQ